MLLGARNGVYGVRLAPLLRVRGAQRLLAAHLVIDESTAVALGGEVQGVRAGRLGFWATGLSVFVLWNAATLLGARRRTRWATRATSAWTRPRRPRSWRCSRRGCNDRATWAIGVVAAAGRPRAWCPWCPPASRCSSPRWCPAVAVLARTGAAMTTWLSRSCSRPGSCYLLKLAGLSVPERWLEHPVAAQVVALLPVALLAALAAVQTFATGTTLVIDARVAGVGVAVSLLLLRAPFIVVVVGAAATAAMLRLLV